MGDTAYQFFEEDWSELLNGKIVAMSPRPVVNHHNVSLNIASIFKRYLKGKSCTAFGDGVDVYLSEKDRVIPDAMIVCDRSIIKTNGIHGAPDLVVEILSPGTAKSDRGYKKNLYEKHGVKEYWLVDTDSRSVEIYLLRESAFELDEIYTIYPDYFLENLTEEEKLSIPREFKTSLFPDFIIALEDVFDEML